MNEDLKAMQASREFSRLGVEFCGAAGMDWPGRPGQKLVPNQTRAYCAFDICFSWPARTAYGSTFHPGTLANSAESMLHAVFNRGHRMKAYDQEKNHIDENFGAVVGVEFAARPAAGWKIGSPPAHYRAAAVIHKQVAFVPKLLGEHLSGRHRWAVSQETDYSMWNSGFIIEPDGRGTPAMQQVMAQYTPEEFKAAKLAYVPVVLDAEKETLCPDELLGCFDFKQRRVTKDWGGRVTLLKGGVNGEVHVGGVGMVRYGAEQEAQIQTLMAADPDQVFAECDAELDLGSLKKVSEISGKLLTAMASAVLRGA